MKWGPPRQFDWNKARALWQLGLDTREIASRLGVHESLVYNTMDWWRKEPELTPDRDSAA